LREKKPNLVVDKTFDFALKIIDIYKYLVNDMKEYVLSKQLLRSGTSIGANVREGIVAQSRKEFVAKLNIALKEAHETEYWLDLLKHSNYLEDNSDILIEIDSVIRIITSIIKTTNENK